LGNSGVAGLIDYNGISGAGVGCGQSATVGSVPTSGAFVSGHDLTGGSGNAVARCGEAQLANGDSDAQVLKGELLSCGGSSSFGKHHRRNVRKRKNKKNKVSSSGVVVREKTELQLSLERKWQAENELALERAKKDLEYQRARDVVAEVANVEERRRAARVQFEQRNYKFEEWAANRKKNSGVTPGFAKTIVSSSSASPSSKTFGSRVPLTSASSSGSHVNSKASSPIGSRGELSALSSLSGNSTSTNREKVLESTMRRMQACIDAKDKKISELTKELRYEIVNSDCSY
jgi:hypothetical protein